MSEVTADTWRKILVGDDKSWVLFEYGTCVILMKPTGNLEEQACEIMREFGPVHAGSPAGDFQTAKLTEDPGWVVGCHHPDILNYVSSDGAENGASEITIGLIGRSNRNKDAEYLKVIHVEDNQPT